MEPARTYAAEAWTIFWAEQGPRSRCLAQSPELSGPLDAHWRAFASTLPPAARIIDLGCGGGAVGRLLRDAQPRLRVVGIDIATTPSTDDPGLVVLSNIPMESLPFADGVFGAAVSQFGYEYGKMDVTAQETARVLLPGSPFSFLVHHPQSPIIAGMRRHRRAIEGLCGLRVQSAFFSGNAGALAERIAAVKRECAGDAILDQAASGLQAHIQNDEMQRLQVWKAVADALAPELMILDSLDLCCADADLDVGHFVKPLSGAFDVRPPKVLRTRLGEPLAWIIQGARRH